MNIIEDSLGNQYIGRLEYGNHSINSPTLNYLKSTIVLETEEQKQDLISTIDTACQNAGIIYSLDGNFSSGNYEINWSSPLDLTRPANGRFRIGVSSSRNIIIQTRDDNNNLVGGSNSITAFDAKLQNYADAEETFRPALFFTISQTGFTFGGQVVNSSDTTKTLSYFAHSGYLQNVNDNFNYYTSKQIYSCFVMAKSSNNIFSGYNYIKNTNKPILTTNDANYPIVCVDSQVPTLEWTTGLYVFDDDELLGFPAIGRVDNFIASTSQTAFTTGIPSIITSTSKPDLGNNRWLPIGTWLGKTLFMRIA